MRRNSVLAALPLVLLVLALPAATTAAPTAWSGSGPGDVNVVSDGTTSDAKLTYFLDPAGFFAPSSWDFFTVADRTGPVTLQYAYEGLHAWFQVRVFLDATVNGATAAALVDDGPVNCCTPPSNGFAYTGEVTLDVAAGDAYGFRFGGSNFDFNNFLTGTVTVHVVNADPDCSAATPSEAVLWPPDHRMVGVGVGGVTDPDGDPVTVTISSIWQDEPVDGVADGNTSPDAAGVGTGTAGVRAERSGAGDGRFYYVGFTAEDGRGGACSGQVVVSVPHDERPSGAAVPGGALYDSTVP